MPKYPVLATLRAVTSKRAFRVGPSGSRAGMTLEVRTWATLAASGEREFESSRDNKRRRRCLAVSRPRAESWLGIAETRERLHSDAEHVKD